MILATLYLTPPSRHAHAELKEAKMQVELFKETIEAKDHVVIELTNKLFQLENKGQIPTESVTYVESCDQLGPIM